MRYLGAALLLSGAYACNRGGGADNPIPAIRAGAPTPQPIAAAPARPHATATPSRPRATPTPKRPAATPTPRRPAATPTPIPTATPPAFTASVRTRIPSTIGRIGLIQPFDYAGPGADNSWIARDASRYDAVWASVYPSGWRTGHPGMLISYYFILGLDRGPVTHRTLAWFNAHHPEWVMYGCKPNGSPTHDVAFMHGIPQDEVPLDLRNSSAVQFEVQDMARNAIAGGYNSLAIDQAVFWNTYGKGNQFGCGVWQNGSFVRRYASVNDPAFGTDVVNYVRTARSVAHGMGLALAINHAAGDIRNAPEQQITLNTDLEVDETGFSDYGNYAGNSGLFARTLAYLLWAQHHGIAVATLNRFTHGMRPEQLEFTLAAYLIANDGGELMFAGVDHRYNGEQYHNEYGSQIGRPCTSASAGPVFARRFSGGMAILNDSRSSASVRLPNGNFRDVEGRTVRNPLTVGASDAYVLLGPGGC